VVHRATDPDAAPSVEVKMPAGADAANTGDLGAAADRTPVADAGAPRDATGDSAALPPGAATVDRPVSVAPGGSTASYGSASGGTRYPDDCGPDGVLVGYHGWSERSVAAPYNPYVISLQAICGTLQVKAGSTAAVTTSTLPLERRGNVGEVEWDAMCPANTVIVGVTGRVDTDMVENFQFRCAPLAVTATTPPALTIGAATALPWSGQRNAGSDVTTSCPAGQVGRGHLVRVGSWIDGYQMTCGTPSLSP
jgi:hypothetical protein